MKKRPGDIIILHMCTKNYDQMYTVPEKWCVTDIIVFSHFGLFFAPNSPKNQNLEEVGKKPRRYHHFT